ncbi:hypothetical protein F0562_006315 [Nyssa sinensis]|uniref:ARM repeat N-terminal plant domain-containing protein n=1 Tax=Nyssa sinensis TaxID=561372 RepID=A0A5J5APF4_9ASTE|nr:hypothetical protein F0562_006315 [Nyssa sinensis]
MPTDDTCTNGSCLFCSINEPDPSLRKARIARCFKEMPVGDDQEHVLALSGLWNTAMNQPDDPEFPSLGIFQCMAKLIDRGVSDKDWLFRDQNIYIPYYAAHVIGSYTMNKSQFADMAIKSGVKLPLMELTEREPELVISDATRALCLSSQASPHGKSLWRRSQAYEMKGLAKESLMDCLKFVNGRVNLEKTKHVKIPYYAVRMINKQMNATWLFAAAKSKRYDDHKEARKSMGQHQVDSEMRTAVEEGSHW